MNRGNGAGHVDDHLLHHRVTAAGITPLAARHEIHPDRLRVRRLRAVEDLHDRRHRVIRGVAGEAVDRQAGGVAEEASQGDLLLPGEFVHRHLPGDEPGIDILIQGQLALLHQPQRPQGRHGLADRAGLEERGGRHRGIPTPLRHAIASRLDDLAVLDDREG